MENENSKNGKISIDELLVLAGRSNASDLLLKVGRPPTFRINGRLVKSNKLPSLKQVDCVEYANHLMNDWQKKKFNQDFEMDTAYSLEDDFLEVKNGVNPETDITYENPKSKNSRFRINIFKQLGNVSIVIRVINNEILTFEQLNLPSIIENITSEERGLVIVTGTTGSGKSTTLASMVDHINATKSKHIITIEDPVEYIHKDKKGLINQREVGVDTRSFNNALRSALREDPDVILVGEMRDLETIELCLTAAETGHLVFATLHALDAQETVNRILSTCPSNMQDQIRYQLSQTLKATISQRLIPTADGRSRVPAVEVMICTGRVKELLSVPERTKEITDAIAEGKLHYGMQTFDQCLLDLYKEKTISYEEAMNQATNKEDLDLKIRGVM